MYDSPPPPLRAEDIKRREEDMEKAARVLSPTAIPVPVITKEEVVSVFLKYEKRDSAPGPMGMKYPQLANAIRNQPDLAAEIASWFNDALATLHQASTAANGSSKCARVAKVEGVSPTEEDPSDVESERLEAGSSYRVALKRASGNPTRKRSKGGSTPLSPNYTGITTLQIR